MLNLSTQPLFYIIFFDFMCNNGTCELPFMVSFAISGIAS